jgi:carboxyl-terminal processing protease
MKHKLAKKAILLLAAAVVFICYVPVFGDDVDRQHFKPMFPVDLDHEFKNAGQTFDEVRQLILDHYYSEDITTEALYWAAIEGMLRQISPPEIPELSKVWTAESYGKFMESIKGEQVSIGIKSTFNPREGSLTVTGVAPDSPADTILKPYDRILRIDSESLKGKSLGDVNAMLSGEADQTVQLTVNRDIKVFDVTLTYQKFNTRNLTVTKLNDRTALVEIRQFTDGMAVQFAEQLDALNRQDVVELIIDLRNNPGGILLEALKMAELLLPEKSVMLRTLQRQTKLQNYISGNKDPYMFRVAVLVNHQTASSAEVLAGSLQDHDRAFIVGTKTFGKGVFENTFTLSNEYRVKFITGAMYSPKGRSWQSRGIVPDFLVEQDVKTLAAILRLEPGERFVKDVAMITAFKLLRMDAGS